MFIPTTEMTIRGSEVRQAKEDRLQPKNGKDLINLGPGLRLSMSGISKVSSLEELMYS